MFVLMMSYRLRGPLVMTSLLPHETLLMMTSPYFGSAYSLLPSPKCQVSTTAVIFEQKYLYRRLSSFITSFLSLLVRNRKKTPHQNWASRY